MDDRAHAAHALLDQRPIPDRADDIGERRGQEVDTDRDAFRRAQAPHQRLAEMACAAGDENGHDGLRADPYQRMVATDRPPAGPAPAVGSSRRYSMDRPSDPAIVPRR